MAADRLPLIPVAPFAQSIPEGSLVLGAGAGCYRDPFRHVRYESADFQQIETSYLTSTTYMCDPADIPVARCCTAARCSAADTGVWLRARSSCH